MRKRARQEAISFVREAVGSFWEFAQAERDRKLAEPAEQWRYHLIMARLLREAKVFKRARIAWHEMKARQWEARTKAECPYTYQACLEKAASR